MKHLASTGSLAALAALTVAVTVSANGRPNPKLPKEVRDMYCLVGKWQGQLDMVAGRDEAKIHASIDCKPASNGYAIQCQSRMSGLPGGAVSEETDLFGFDPGARKYHWYSVTNMGETHDHVANIPKGNTVSWLYKGTMDGKPFREALQMKFLDGSKRIAFRSNAKSGTTTLFALHGTLTKK